MGLFITAIIFAVLGLTGLFLVRRFFNKGDEGRAFSLTISSVALLVGVIFFISSVIALVPAGHTGVKVVFGNVKTERTLPEGLHVVAPWVSVTNMNVRLQDYTMSSRYSEGDTEGDDSITVKSRDGLQLTMTMTVQYYLKGPQAGVVYQELGDHKQFERTFIRPTVRDVIRNITSQYKGQSIYGEKRNNVREDIFEAVKEEFEEKGFLLDSIRLRKVDPPKDVRKAIQKKIAAKERIKQKEYEVEAEQMEAKRKMEEARGLSQSMKILTDNLTDNYLQFKYLQALQSLVNSPNTTFFVAPYDQSVTPMINMPADRTGDTPPPTVDNTQGPSGIMEDIVSTAEEAEEEAKKAKDKEEEESK